MDYLDYTYEQSFGDPIASVLDYVSLYVEKQVTDRLTPSPTLPSFQDTSPVGKIAIVGGGVAGLYAAMILKDLGLDFEIIEASDRIGGRIYTHHFSKDSRYDYFDVGAMRFPGHGYMAPLFELFDKLGIKAEPGGLLRKFIFSAPKQTFQFYNNIRVRGEPTDKDPFNNSRARGGNVQDDYVAKGSNFWIDETFAYFVKLFQDIGKLPVDKRQEAFEKAWTELMKQDHFSTRGYMLAGPNGKPNGAPPAFPGPVVDWLETFSSATGTYNKAFSESVLSKVHFDLVDPQGSTKELPEEFLPASARDEGARADPPWLGKWWCIDGGAEEITQRMLKKLEDLGSKLNIRTKTPVTKIRKINKDNKEVLEVISGKETVGTYSHIILTPSLGCIQLMDLDECELSYTQRLAIRSLIYSPSTKIGIKFQSRWWENPQGILDDKPIVGGVSKTDLPIRQCIYPSYGPNPTLPEVPGVLLASYTFSQDAARLGSLANGNGTDKAVLEAVLNDIARLHNIPRDKLPEPINHYIHSWYNDPYTRGAFAHYGPSQFGVANDQYGTQSMFVSMKAPAAKGRLHFAGEATSIHHGWVLGALNSARRAVNNALYNRPDLRKKLFDNWGHPKEDSPQYLDSMVILADDGKL